MPNQMRAISINPELQIVSEVFDTFNDFRCIQLAIGGHSFECVRLGRNLKLFVDANASLRPGAHHWFWLEPLRQPLSGKALLLGSKSGSPQEWPVPKRYDLDFIRNELVFTGTGTMGDAAAAIQMNWRGLTGNPFVDGPMVASARF